MPWCRWLRVDAGRHDRTEEHLHLEREDRPRSDGDLRRRPPPWQSRREHTVGDQVHPVRDADERA